MVSSGLMVTNTGLSGRGCSGAVLAGRLTPISTVASGAATMKMIKQHQDDVDERRDVDLVLDFEIVVART